MVKSTGIPRLGDQFAVGQHGIVGDGFEERGVGKRMSLRVTAEHGGEVETKSVDVVFGGPVAQAIEDEVADHGVVAVEGVAATAEVEVIAVGCEEVVGLVVEAAEGNDGAGRVALGGVVEDNIEDDLDTGGVERFDQIFEFVDLLAVLTAGGEAGFGGAEGERAVAPVVDQLFAGLRVVVEVFVFVELENRHEFHAVHAEFLQVGNFLAQSIEGARMHHAGGGVTGEAADVKFVDDEFGHGQIERAVVFPVEIVFRDTSAVLENIRRGRTLAEDGAAADGASERVEENVALVEAMAGVRVERAVHAVAVFDTVGVDVEDHHGEDIAHTEFGREGNLGEGALGAFFKKDEGAGGGVGREDGEVDAARHQTGAEGKRVAVAQAEDAVVVRRVVLAGDRGAGGLRAGGVGAYFHLMLQPMLACCGSGAAAPASSASRAWRRSEPSQATPLPGVLPSRRPW